MPIGEGSVFFLYLKDLLLVNFRNYDKLELSFDSNLVLFVGRNGQGKTNILESIFLCCTGRSHRTSRDKELVKWQSEGALVRIGVEKSVGDSRIEIHLKSSEKKRILINAVNIARIGELMGHLNSVIFSPEDMKLVKEGPVERRRFMDMELSQIRPRYFYYLQQYNRILNHRNNLLKEIRFKGSLRKTLPVWNMQLAEAGSNIIEQRHGFCISLNSIAGEIHRNISHGTEKLALSYRPSIPYKSAARKDILEAFIAELEAREQEDIERGSTGRGCHRDDISISINGADVRIYGSQGQQRTTVLSLKLSEIEFMHGETGEYPVLLLDDVMSELDAGRQQMLLEYIKGVQTFITAADIRHLPDINGMNPEVFTIAGGRVQKCDFNGKHALLE